MSLITSISEFREYISLDANTKWDSIKPYVKEAEQMYLVPLLGKAFYDEFHPLYLASVATPTPVPLSGDNAALLPYIQRALAYYSQLRAIPHLASTFGELGVRVHRGEDSDAAPRWKEEKLMLNALVSGDTHADNLLEFLEANASVSKYNTWYSSTANTINSGYLVWGTLVASRHIDISGSRRVFMQLRPTLQELERRFIPKLVGSDQYEELVTQLKTGTVSPENAALIIKLEGIVCKRALYMRLPFMQVSISADGVWLYSDTTEIRKRDFLAQREDIKALRHELMDGPLGYVADEDELRQFLLDNIDDYPLIKASTVYTVQPDPGPTWQPLNDVNKKHFGV